MVDPLNLTLAASDSIYLYFDYKLLLRNFYTAFYGSSLANIS